jgi:hypothetical protein
MRCEISFAEGRFRSWYGRQSREDLDFRVVVNRVWDLLSGELRDPEQEEAFYLLICFVMRARRTANLKIRQSCFERGLSFWDTLVQRAGCVYQRIGHKISVLRVKKTELGEEFYRYLYKAMEYSLIECNTQCQNDLNSNIREVNDPGDLDDLAEQRRNRGFVGRFNDPGFSQPIHIIANDIWFTRLAEVFADNLKKDWEPKLLNVLCHWIEVNSGVHSGRLSNETAANIDQLHSRIKKRLFDYIEKNKIEKEVVRVFFAHYAAKFCQDIPVSRTYRLDKEVADDTHI